MACASSASRLDDSQGDRSHPLDDGVLKQDLFLIHPPSVFDFRDREQFRGPIADVIPSGDQFEMFPIGITSIAAYLARNNYSVRIVNLARRMVAEGRFDAEAH